MRIHRTWTMVGVVMGMALYAGSVLALDEGQQEVHRQAQSALKAATADLEAARSSAGSAGNPAKGSRLRLTQTRLNSAKQKLEQAASLLGKLPAEDEAVAPTRQGHDTAVKAAAEIQAIIDPPADKEEASHDGAKKDDAAGQDTSGRKESAEADKGKDKPAGSSPKLDYKQEEQLRNARFHLREVAGGLEGVKGVVAAMDDPKGAVVHGQVVNALKLADQVRTKLTYAGDALAKLPAEHEMVAPLVKQAADAGVTLGALRSRLESQEKSLGKQADVGSYPQYDKDFTLLQEFARRYGDFDNVSQDPERMAQVIREDGQVLREVQRIARTYLPLVEQKTDAGQRMEKLFNHFQAQRASFAQRLGDYKQALSVAFQKEIDQAMALASQAVEEKKPAFFGPDGGIAQQLGFAQQKLMVIEAFGEEAAKPFQEKMGQARDQIKARGKALEAQIIATNAMPGDNYQGPDRDAIIAIAKDGWSHQQKDAKVLKAVIVGQAWKRDTRWRWSGDAFNKMDVSRIQVQLVIQHDDRLAVIQPINVHKNHQEQDRLTGHPMRSGDETPPPQAFLLLERVK